MQPRSPSAPRRGGQRGLVQHARASRHLRRGVWGAHPVFLRPCDRGAAPSPPPPSVRSAPKTQQQRHRGARSSCGRALRQGPRGTSSRLRRSRTIENHRASPCGVFGAEKDVSVDLAALATLGACEWKRAPLFPPCCLWRSHIHTDGHSRPRAGPRICSVHLPVALSCRKRGRLEAG